MSGRSSRRRLGAALASAAALALAACADSHTARDAACARLEGAWSLQDLPSAGACPAPAAPRDVSTSTRVAVAVYHFNLQYVAGGLRGFPDGTPSPTFDLDERAVEDRIVRQGFEPALDLYLRQPSFHADFELQGYMVEVIAARHPDVLAKMRTLAERGQVEFISFHYSDQLYVAYPREDLERSLALTRAVFDRACVPLGTSIFTQEGQFARGQLPIAAAHGYRVSVLPKNLFRYQFGDEAARAGVLFSAPEAPDHVVVLGGQSHTWSHGPGAPFELAWTFMDDGEIAFTEGKLNPYFGTDYRVDPARLAEHEARLLDLERQGFVHATLREAVDAARTRGLPLAPLPPVLDGTWQPDDTGNVFRWMGGAGLFRTFEQDGDLLAAVWRARRSVLTLGAPTAEPAARGVAAAWRELLLAEVSDSTGWNPFRTEIAYARAHAEQAAALASAVHACLDSTPPEPPAWPCTAGEDVTLESLGAAVIAPARAPTVRARRCTNAPEGERWAELVVSVPQLATEEPVLDATTQDADQRDLEVRFTRASTAAWSWVPALSDAPVSARASDYTFDEIAVSTLPGPVQLGPRRWVVPDASTQRVALHLARTGEWVGTDRWIDHTVSRTLASERRWLVLEDASAESAARVGRAVESIAPR